MHLLKLTISGSIDFVGPILYEVQGSYRGINCSNVVIDFFPISDGSEIVIMASKFVDLNLVNILERGRRA